MMKKIVLLLAVGVILPVLSARELRESVENAQGQISALLADLRQKENRKFNTKEVPSCMK